MDTTRMDAAAGSAVSAAAADAVQPAASSTASQETNKPIDPTDNAAAAAAAAASTSVASRPPPSIPLDFALILSTLIDRVASGGLEGRSLSALFQHAEWAETLRRREEKLAERSRDRATLVDTPTAACGDGASDPLARLDPFVRFHLIRLLREKRKDVTFFCKHPLEVTAADLAAAAASTPTTSNVDGSTDAAAAGASAAPRLVRPSRESLQNDSSAQLAYLRSLCESIRTQQSSHMVVLMGGAPPPSDQSLLDESVARASSAGWVLTGQGLLHATSVTRFALQPTTLEQLLPAELYTLSSCIVLVASMPRRCRFLGITEDDLVSLAMFQVPKTKAGGGAAANNPATLPVPEEVAREYGQPTVMVNLLETIGKFSVQSMVAPPVPAPSTSSAKAGTSSSGALTAEQEAQDKRLAFSSGIPLAPAPSASAPTNHGGILQPALAKLMGLSSGNAFRFLLILEGRGLVTPVRVLDDLSVSNLGAGWRWYLGGLSPSTGSAARVASSTFHSIHAPFSSMGTVSADLPLQAWQANMHSLYGYYRDASWRTVRGRIKKEKDRETERLIQKYSVATATAAAAAGPGVRQEDGMDLDADSAGGSSKVVKHEDGAEGASGANDARGLTSHFPTLDVPYASSLLASIAPRADTLLGTSLAQQMYRLLVDRGVRGTTTMDIRAHFHDLYTQKLLQSSVQSMIKNYNVASVADQTGKTMAFRFFTREDFDEFGRLLKEGASASAMATGVKGEKKVTKAGLIGDLTDTVAPVKTNHARKRKSQADSGSGAAGAAADKPERKPRKKKTPGGEGATARKVGRPAKRDVMGPTPVHDVSAAAAAATAAPAAASGGGKPEAAEEEKLNPVAEEKEQQQPMTDAPAAQFSIVVSSAPAGDAAAAGSSAVSVSAAAPAAAGSAAGGVVESDSKPSSLLSSATLVPPRLRNPRVNDPKNSTRTTLKTMQRDEWVVAALHQSAGGILKASDVSRLLWEKEMEANDGVPRTAGEFGHLTSKSAQRMWTRLSTCTPPQLQQMHISVPTQNGGFKKTLVLLMPDLDVDAIEVKERAIAVAQTVTVPPKSRERMGQRGTKRGKGKKRKVTMDEDEEVDDEEEEEGAETGEDVDEEEERAAAMLMEADPTLAAAAMAAPHTPAKKTRKKKSDAAAAESGASEDDTTPAGESALFYPLTHGFIRPKMARLRWLMERLWERYAQPDARVRPLIKEGPATDSARPDVAAAKEKNEPEEQKQGGAADVDGDVEMRDADSDALPPQVSSSALASSVLAAAANANTATAAAAAAPGDLHMARLVSLTTPPTHGAAFPTSGIRLPPSTAPLLSFPGTALFNELLLRDYLSLIGLTEKDFRSPFAIGLVTGSPAHFDLCVGSDPKLSAWCRMMMAHSRTHKLGRLRSTIQTAHALGLLLEAGKVPTPIEKAEAAAPFPCIATPPVLASNIGHYILAPRFTLLADEYDMTTREGRDAMWRRLKEEAIKVIARKDRLGKGGEANAEHQQLQPTTTSPAMPPLESAVQAARAAAAGEVAMLPASAAAGAAGSPSSSTSELLSPVLLQFPHQQFPDLYKKQCWVMGKPFDSAIVQGISSITPPVGQTPMSSDIVLEVKNQRFLKTLNTSVFSCYIACARYPWVREVYERLALLDSSSQAMFPAAANRTAKGPRKPVTAEGTTGRHPPATPASGTATTGGKKGRPLKHIADGSSEATQTAKRGLLSAVLGPSAVASGASGASAYHDPDHIPQPLNVPFRRSTSQQEADLRQDQEEEADEGEEEEEEDDEEEAPSSSAPAAGSSFGAPFARQLVSVKKPRSPRPKLTRVRWREEEDQQLIQIFNEWFMHYYAPAMESSSTAAPTPSELYMYDPSSPHIPNINSFASNRMSTSRDVNACRRRLEVLRNKGKLPALVSVGPAGATAHRVLNVTHLTRDIYPKPLATSLLHFVQMLFSHPPDRPFHAQVAQAVISGFSDIQVDQVLKALRLDKWVSATKSNENQTGRSWKFSANWQEVLKPQWIGEEVWTVARGFMKPWKQLAGREGMPAATPATAVGTRGAPADAHQFSVGPMVPGGEVAAIFALREDGELELRPKVKDQGGECIDMVDVVAMPLVQDWVEGELVPPPPKPRAAMTAAAAIAAQAARSRPISHTMMSHLLNRSISSLHVVPTHFSAPTATAAAAAASSAAPASAGLDAFALGEEWLLPNGGRGAPMEVDEKTSEDVDMAVDAPAAAGAAASASGSASTTSSKEDLSFLDTPAVKSAENAIISLVEAAGADGIEWQDLHGQFLRGASVAPSASGPPPSQPPSPSLALSSDSSLFDLGLARALNFLSIVRVCAHDSHPRYVHQRHSAQWVVPTFNEQWEADFKDTAILPHPWRGVNGDINDDRLQAFLDSILALLLHHPGLPPASLVRQLPILPPSELEHCLQLLITDGRVTVETLPVEDASLFSQPFGMETDASTDREGRRRARKKQRHTGPAEKEVPKKMERFLFPTVRAFTVSTREPLASSDSSRSIELRSKPVDPRRRPYI